MWLGLVGVALFVVRIPFLPPTLDDIDAINFDLGVHEYDPTRFQPHPPGYPVFIALARLTHPLFPSHAAGLAALSAFFGALTLCPLYLLIRELTDRRTAVLGSLLVVTSPLVWFSSARPMSDMTGLFAVLLAQCLLVLGLRRLSRAAAAGKPLWLAGTVVAGLAIGVRAQAVFLVGPLMLAGWLRCRAVRLSTPALLIASVSAWFVPLVWASGGLDAYASSLALLLSTALPAEPLLVAPTIRRAVYAVWDVLGSPWGPPWLAGAVLLMGAAGAIRCLLWRRALLGWALLLFLPYALYHYLLQMTEAIRYAIPVVPLVALLAASAVAESRIRRLAVPVVGFAFVAASAVWTLPALNAYHREPSPTAQALDRLEAAARAEDVVIAGHPVFERYLAKLAQAHTVLMPDFTKAWRPLVEYWSAEGRKPILFLRNPRRSSLLQLARAEQTSLGRWRWPAPVRPFMRGERPSRVELVRIAPPSWFIESGFMVTREAGQPDAVAREPYRLHVRDGGQRRLLMVSGQILDRPKGRLALRRSDGVEGPWDVSSAFTIRALVPPSGPADHYDPWTFESDTPVLFTDIHVQEEGKPAIRPGRGFYSAEIDEEGNRFHWIAPAAAAEAYAPGPARLMLRGWIPVRYYNLPVTLALQWNGEPLEEVEITTPEFVIERDVPGAGPAMPWATLTLSVSQWFVPDDLQHSGDHRLLSAQIREMALAPGAPPPAAAKRR